MSEFYSTLKVHKSRIIHEAIQQQQCLKLSVVCGGLLPMHPLHNLIDFLFKPKITFIKDDLDFSILY